MCTILHGSLRQLIVEPKEICGVACDIRLSHLRKKIGPTLGRKTVGPVFSEGLLFFIKGSTVFAVWKGKDEELEGESDDFTE